MRRIAILTSKGGTGKTTIALSLSHTLASLKGKQQLQLPIMNDPVSFIILSNH